MDEANAVGHRGGGFARERNERAGGIREWNKAHGDRADGGRDLEVRQDDALGRNRDVAIAVHAAGKRQLTDLRYRIKSADLEHPVIEGQVEIPWIVDRV